MPAISAHQLAQTIPLGVHYMVNPHAELLRELKKDLSQNEDWLAKIQEILQDCPQTNNIYPYLLIIDAFLQKEILTAKLAELTLTEGNS